MIVTVDQFEVMAPLGVLVTYSIKGEIKEVWVAAGSTLITPPDAILISQTYSLEPQEA